MPQRELRSRRLWEGSVRQGLLPDLLAWAALAEERCHFTNATPTAQQLRLRQEREAQKALGVRGCANPLCTNMRGCSEGRLHGRRCSGCRLVRYCSKEC